VRAYVDEASTVVRHEIASLENAERNLAQESTGAPQPRNAIQVARRAGVVSVSMLP